MTRALRQHWPEFLMEAACLGTFKISAGVFTALLEYPNSSIRRACIEDARQHPELVQRIVERLSFIEVVAFYGTAQSTSHRVTL